MQHRNPNIATYPWQRAIVWMLALGSLFFIGYPLTNMLASVGDPRPVPVLLWESDLPFVAWSIVPYLSINLLFPLSFFWCATRADLDTHTLRLLFVQLACYAVFIVWPTSNDRIAPEQTGFARFLFDTLHDFDRPYNMAPSLHIAVLVALVDLARRYAQGLALWSAILWACLIGISTLTTWQHHVFDVVSGAAVGWAAVAIIKWKSKRE